MDILIKIPQNNLQNVFTSCWIFYNKVMKDPLNHKAKEVLELLTNYQIMLSMAGLILKLEKMHSLVL